MKKDKRAQGEAPKQERPKQGPTQGPAQRPPKTPSAEGARDAAGEAGAPAAAARTAAASPLRQSAEQGRYALVLQWGTRAGLALSALGFVAYMFGLAPARVPLERLPELWSMPVERFLQATGETPGWGWAAHLLHGDMVALAGLALLATCSVPALLALVLPHLRRGERAAAALCVAVALVILLAASGALTVHA